MKWLLASTVGPNPGDAFVRVGVQRLIEAVDPAAQIRLVDKETRAIGQKQPFDRAVWCGMPLFWSHPETWSWSMGWWEQVGRGWLSEDPRRYMIVGAGSFASWPGKPVAHKPERLYEETLAVKNGCWRLIARDPVAPVLTGVPMEVMPCPALFATRGVEVMDPGARLCNFMPDGGHYRLYGPKQAEAWDAKAQAAADILKGAGFRFVAHCEFGHVFGEKLGFTDIITDSRDPQYLLSAYAGCSKYFGNRVHGAIAAAGAGADVLGVGYDSRQEAVRLCGGRVTSPMDLSLNELEKWAVREPVPAAIDTAVEFEKQRQIFEAFAA